jgi:hypothetical protein
LDTNMKKHFQLLTIALTLASLPALAADKAPEPPQSPPSGSTPVPDGAPTASDIGEPSITIRNKGRERIEEYRLKGKLYMVRITPPKGKPYYLVDQMGRGEFIRHEGPAAPTAVPQWVIGTF